MRETRILDALGALAENDRRMGVSPVVETRLTRAFRARRKNRTFPWVAVCSIAAAAAIAIVIGAIWPQRPPTIVTKPSVVVAVKAVAVKAVAVKAMPAAIEMPKASALPPRPLVARRIPKPARVEEQTSYEVVTDFFPLMDPAPPFDRGQILRVQLPATAMQAVGLPVGDGHLADQIQADVLVGEEGLPRAIRFVRFEMK